MTAAELRGVTLTAHDANVLDNVNLTVPDSGVLAICGPQEAGKSVLLRVLAGLTDVDDGHVLIRGADVGAKKSRQRNVSLMLPTIENYPHLNVRENLAFAARLRKTQAKSAIRERVIEVAQLLEIDHLLTQRPSQLSRAEQQLLALGRALVRDAAVYAFDEPLGAVDPRTRSSLRSRILAWQQSMDRATIWVTGNTEEALSVGDDVAVMHQGRVHQVDAPRDLFDFPIDVFVAGFLGQPAMNLIPGRVADGSVHLPFLSLPLDERLIEAAGGSDLVVVGVRPGACREAALLSPNEQLNNIEFTSVVDEIEWSADRQFAYVGYELDDDIIARLESLEDALEFDVFATHLIAALAYNSALEAGQALRISVDPQDLHVFDAETGVNLSMLASDD